MSQWALGSMGPCCVIMISLALQCHNCTPGYMRPQSVTMDLCFHNCVMIFSSVHSGSTVSQWSAWFCSLKMTFGSTRPCSATLALGYTRPPQCHNDPPVLPGGPEVSEWFLEALQCHNGHLVPLASPASQGFLDSMSPCSATMLPLVP